jgi:PhoH-like ATPase
MGNDIGYLPGNIDEKLGPWMQPIFDNIDFLFNISKAEKSFDAYEDLANEGLLKIEALTYIRGRSIPDQYMIIDEAQNLSKHEVKTIISRAGEGTKIVLTGDPDQIDNPKLDSINNGLTYIIEKFKDQDIAAHIHLSKGERSELANIASDIL